MTGIYWTTRNDNASEPNTAGVRVLVPERDAVELPAEAARRGSGDRVRQSDAQQARDPRHERARHGQLHVQHIQRQTVLRLRSDLGRYQ